MAIKQYGRNQIYKMQKKKKIASRRPWRSAKTARAKIRKRKKMRGTAHNLAHPPS
jgi:hypothetical protein